MMIQMTPSESASQHESKKSSPELEFVKVLGSDGSVRDISRKRSIQASTGQCTIYQIAPSVVEPNNASFSAFDDLVKSLEEEQETKDQLSEGRKWIAEAFYMEAPTLAA